MGTSSPLFCVVVAITVGLCLQPLVVRVMLRHSILDIPGSRSSHTTPTPRGGGIAVVTALILALAPDPGARVFGIPLVLFAAIGLAEDLRGLSIPARILQQLVAGGVVAVLFAASRYTGLFLLAVALSGTLWLTVYVNAFNFMDGLNGMSASHAMLAGLIYSTAGQIEELHVLTVVGAATAAAAATFLPWNAGRATIFLGDVGSYGLGALLAATAAYALLEGLPVEATVAPLALYLTDTGWTLARRWYQGEKWYEAHRSHVYQRLANGGWSHQVATVFTVAVAAMVGVCGLMAGHLTMPFRLATDVLAASVLTIYLTMPGILARRRMRAYATDGIRAERRTHA
jgi:UDP-GlcNAc:undecaprenyl-phosphate/decaprenyl-phosphate GlcNAc-1-phosphate transferase